MRAKRIFWGAVAGLAIVAMLPALGEAATIDPTAVSIGKAVSADGRYAVFERPTTLYYPSPGLNVYLEDLRAGRVTLVSHIYGSSKPAGSSGFFPAISGNGRWVAFMSTSPQLVPNGQADDNMYLYDRLTGQNRMISKPSTGLCDKTGSTNPWRISISEDGSKIAYVKPYILSGSAKGCSAADGVVVYDQAAHSNHKELGPAYDPEISPDGRFLCFTDNAGLQLYDQVKGTKKTLPTPAESDPDFAGHYGQGMCSMSRDAARVAFLWYTQGHYEVFVYDSTTHDVTLVSLDPTGARFAKGASSSLIESPFMSPDGRFVVFGANGGEYVRDVDHGHTYGKTHAGVTSAFRFDPQTKTLSGVPILTPPTPTPTPTTTTSPVATASPTPSQSAVAPSTSVTPTATSSTVEAAGKATGTTSRVPYIVGASLVAAALAAFAVFAVIRRRTVR